MKKKLLSLSFFVIGLMLIVGCSNSASKDDISLTPSDKAEVVVKSEYVSRIKRLVEDTISNDEIILNEEEKAEKEDEYDKKYLESETLDERHYGGDRDRYKDFVVGLSTFRTEDEEVNVLHDKLIEVSLDVYNMLNEKIELGIEKNSIYSKGEIEESDLERLDAISESQDTLDEMIDNQIEHTGNIGIEIFEILGVDNY